MVAYLTETSWVKLRTSHLLWGLFHKHYRVTNDILSFLLPVQITTTDSLINKVLFQKTKTFISAHSFA